MMAAVMEGPANVAKFIGRLLKWVWRVCESVLIGIIVMFAFFTEEWVVEPEWSDIQEVSSGLYIISAGCYDGLWSVSKGWICNVEYDSIKASKSGENW